MTAGWRNYCATTEIEIELADGVSAYSFLPKMVSYALAGPVARVNH
jgi:hypothetical protein